jgi:hypothetical protein
MTTELKSSMLPCGERGQVSMDPLTSLTLPSRYYYDESIYRQEMTHIHRKSWT